MTCASHIYPLLVDSDSVNIPYGARFRKRRPGPESDLVEAFLRVMPLAIPRGCRATVFREPRLESGYPDLVIVVWRHEVTLDWRAEREALKTQDLRLMHFLHHIRRASGNKIARWFGRGIAASIERLRRAAMIRYVGSLWAPCQLRQSFAAAEIIAVEAKIGKWSEVLNQALLNTWFASKSYVLVSNPPSARQLTDAQQLGIGVCSPCGDAFREVVSNVARLPRSYASWVLNEWAWRSSLNERVKMA